jgi:CheY-like chemotaxis protein
VRDTGVGMEASTRQRIFEPFFTTKPVGAGTGLGLAVVYGVVTQAGGTVRAESVVGRGTELRIVMPRSDDEPDASGSASAMAAPSAGTVLLVDDDAAVRSTTRRLLQHRQFTVLEAGNGEEALRLFTAERDRVTILLTDVRMPVMDGVRLAHAVRAIDATLPIVFFSGYDEIDADEVQTLQGVPLLAKPFSLEKLIAALRDAMSGRPAAG